MLFEKIKIVNYCKILVALFFLFSISSLYAAEASIKIGYVDLQEVLLGSKAGQEAKKAVAAEVEKSRQSIDEKQAAIKLIEDEYNKQARVLTEGARAEKEEEIRKKKVDLKRFVDDADRENRNQEATHIQKIIKDVTDLILKIGKEDGYTIIFEKTESAILYAADGIDLTAKVIARYDAEKSK